MFAGDGRQAAAHLLQWSVRQQCPHPEAFTADMEALFRRECDIRYAAALENLLSSVVGRGGGWGV